MKRKQDPRRDNDALGTIVYEDGNLILPITRIALRRGGIYFEARIEPTKDMTYHLGGWARIHGGDGEIVLPRVRLPAVSHKGKAYISFVVEQGLAITSTVAGEEVAR